MFEEYKTRLMQFLLWMMRPKPEAQLTFMHEIEAFRATNMIDKLDERIRSNPAFQLHRKHYPQIESPELSLSEKLELLGFHDQVVVCIRNGEDIGNLAFGVETATKYLQLASDIKEKSTGKIVIGLFLTVVSLAILLVIPSFVAATLESLMNSSLSMKATPASYLLLWMASNQLMVMLILLSLIAVLITLYIFRDDWLDIIMLRMVFKPLIDYIATRRSLRFIVVWKMYRSVGLPLDQDRVLLNKVLGTRVYKRVLPSLQEGKNLATVIGEEQFSFAPILAGPIVSLSALSGDTFADAAASITKLLALEQKKQAGRLALYLNLLGAGISVATVLLVVYGLIFPVLSLQVSHR